MSKRRVVSCLIMIVVVLTVFGLGLTVAQQKVVVLTYWNWTAREGDMPWERELIAKFEEEHPNIKVELVVNPYHEHHPKIIRATKAGKPPDVFQCVPEQLVNFVLIGSSAPLNDYIAAEGEGFTDGYLKSALNFCQWNGETYGLPWRYGCSAMYINLDLFEEAGVALPQDPEATEITWTWYDFLLTVMELRDKLPEGKYPFAFSASAIGFLASSWEWFSWFFQAGGEMITEDGKAGINSSPGIEALSLMVDLYNKYHVVPESELDLADRDCMDLFGRDVVAMWQNGPWFIVRLKGMHPDTRFTTVMLPKFLHDGAPVGGTLLSMSPQTKHPDEAWAFIKFMTRQAILKEWSIRGHFMPPRKDLLDLPEFREPPMKAFSEQAKKPHAMVLGNKPRYEALSEILQKAIEKALIGIATPKEALNEAANEWNKLLAEFYE